DPELVAIAERNGLSPAVVALAWALDRGVVPIPKATGDHVTENLRAVDVDLPESALDAIDALDPGDRQIDPDDAAWNR
ncbi:MAG: aldo/keto reductase, partial [Halorubrum sp.]